MEKENIDLGGLSMEKLFDKLTPAEFKQLSPSQKINIEINNELFIVGFNIICDEYDLKYDLKDLMPNTIVMIDTRHLVECALMIAGGIFCVSKVLNMDCDIHNDIWQVMSRINNNLAKYDDLDIAAKIIANKYARMANTTIENNKILNKLYYTIKNIWFLPYGEIDKIKEQIKKELGEKENERDN